MLPLLFLCTWSHAATQPLRPKNADDTGILIARQTNAKSLVVFYSYSGFTRRVADRLALILEADIYEIRTVKAYPNDNFETALVSQVERRTDNLPEITDDRPDLSGYSRIFIGGPIWNANTATPLASYLALTDLTGKIVAPFWTDHGSGIRGYVADFKSRTRNPLKVTEGLGITYSQDKNVSELDTILRTWIVKVGAR